MSIQKKHLPCPEPFFSFAFRENLGISHPEKLFYALSKDCVCHNMKVTTIADVLHCLEGTDGEEILLEESVRLRAKKSIDEMIRLGK